MGSRKAFSPDLAAVDANGKQIYQVGSGGYYTFSADGAATSPAPSKLAGQTAGDIVAANNQAHKTAVNDVNSTLKAAGINTETEVTMNATVNGQTTTARADIVVTAPKGTTSLPVPEGYAATNVNDNALTSIPLNSDGQAILEVKTGGGALTGNQSGVYPQAVTGNATGVGVNAAKVDMGGSIAATPVTILTKVGK